MWFWTLVVYEFNRHEHCVTSKHKRCSFKHQSSTSEQLIKFRIQINVPKWGVKTKICTYIHEFCISCNFAFVFFSSHGCRRSILMTTATDLERPPDIPGGRFVGSTWMNHRFIAELFTGYGRISRRFGRSLGLNYCRFQMEWRVVGLKSLIHFEQRFFCLFSNLVLRPLSGYWRQIIYIHLENTCMV